MMSLYVFALISTANATNTGAETLSFSLSMQQQSCRRHSDEDPFLCSADPPQLEPVRVFLQPVNPDPLEEQAFEGVSGETGMTLPGGVGQYLPRVTVHKGVAMNGTSVIYTLRFRTFQLLSGGKPIAYETIYMSEPPFQLTLPLVLMADRYTSGANNFKQVVFNLASASGQANP